ncbi:MAG TPA: ABC transporter ATP-binding protein [Bryobacteraceae bacterium]|nr:ABC transporter ATP-binding protein [Bryobacteraceae bacterium]
MSSILEARNVSFAYGPAKWAIRELSLSLDRPERVCLLGSNGVGKSTLMLLLNGTLRPQEGELFVLGHPIDYSRAGLHKLRREVGMVLQDPDDQLFGATVEQDVAFGPLNNGVASNEARTLVDATLAALGISHLAERPIHELSLGEKKRVAIAGALVLRPRIILLDEPTAGLDFAGICAMLALLKKLHQEGTTLVISTHDTDLAYEWANEAWVLGAGRVAAQGPIAEVMKDRITLHQAHLKVPWIVELGLAVAQTYPELSAQPLPATQDELIALIQQIRLASAA